MLEELITNVDPQWSKVSATDEGEMYQYKFVQGLRKKFPRGLKLYHRTPKENVPSILKNGLRVSEDTGVINTVLGDPNVVRIGGGGSGNIALLQISILPKEYGRLFPEEATYYDSELMQDDDFDEDGTNPDKIFLVYMKSHKNLVGGDIELVEDVPPERIKLVKYE